MTQPPATVVAVVQTDPVFGDVAGNLDAAEAAIGGVDADLVVLPELFASGYVFESAAQARELAEPAPGGPTVRRLERIAREAGVTIVAGLPELAGGRVYNSAVVVAPTGWLGTYRKTHLFGEETLHFTPGDTGFRVWTVTNRRGRSFRLGVMICFDWYVPESARTLALAGADVVAHPSNLVLTDCPGAMPVRARENRVFTATANRIGTEANSRGAWTFIGQSRICGPRGDVLADAPADVQAVIRAEIEPRDARDKSVGGFNDVLADRRPEMYDPTPRPTRRH